MPFQLAVTILFCFLGKFLLQSLSFQFVLIINHAGIIYTPLVRNNEKGFFIPLRNIYLSKLLINKKKIYEGAPLEKTYYFSFFICSVVQLFENKKKHLNAKRGQVNMCVHVSLHCSLITVLCFTL